jgi:hypothetical protein
MSHEGLRRTSVQLRVPSTTSWPRPPSPAGKNPYQRHIEAADEESDAPLYELYGSPEEEIAIAEGQP